MTATARETLRRLVRVTPVEVPTGESGIKSLDEQGEMHAVAPVITAYLDMRPQATGERPGLRAARVTLRERLHQIEQSFLPRGLALDSVRADAERIEHYLDTQAAPSAQGIAIFACDAAHLFETLEVGAPFETEVSARAEPNLFQLARLLDDQETAVVAITRVNAVRLFAVHLGGLREAQSLRDDPKLYHMVHNTNAMNQAHYQRHTLEMRRLFMADVAQRIERLVDRTRASRVVLVGSSQTTHALRQALSSRIAALVQEPSLPVDIETPTDVILDQLQPVLRAAEAEEDLAIEQRLLDAVRAGALGVAGVEATRRALRSGQVDTLVLAADATFPPETRSALIKEATASGAAIEVVENARALRQLGGVGALLRYRLAEPAPVGVRPDATPPPPGPAPLGPHTQA